MNAELNNILQKTLQELSEELRAVLYSDRFSRSLSAITEGHPLQEHQKIAAENEVLLVMLGLENPKGLVTNIKHHVKISRDRAEKIVKVVNDTILLPHQAVLENAFTKMGSPKYPDQKNSVVRATQDTFKNRMEKEVHTPREERSERESLKKKRPTHEYAVDPYHEPIE